MIGIIHEASPNTLAGSFTRDLVFSKLWLATELDGVVKRLGWPKIDTMYVLGSWYSNLAVIMDRMGRPVDRIINIDQDSECLHAAQGLSADLGVSIPQEWMHSDANDLDYRQLGTHSVVVNSSLNDIYGRKWFYRIPAGTMVVLQARDQVDSQPYQSAEQIRRRWPLRVHYQGQLDLQDPETAYRRSMIIGERT